MTDVQQQIKSWHNQWLSCAAFYWWAENISIGHARSWKCSISLQGSVAKMSAKEKIKIWQEIKERSSRSFLYKTHCITSVLFSSLDQQKWPKSNRNTAVVQRKGVSRGARKAQEDQWRTYQKRRGTRKNQTNVNESFLTSKLISLVFQFIEI